ncbi:hypothetical protein [Planktotalea frisia]|jgi:hypothetical protein|uniref:hypothetical protein n=1 Tax=Planktotalea frisia TaxID=696762 RepID=UPI0023555104|nr:hypothetical protein [Planktotalea frisia]
MKNPNADEAIEVFTALLDKLKLARNDADQYAVLAGVVLENLSALVEVADASDPRLVGLNNELLYELVYSAKSAELRSPVAGAVKVLPGASKY